MAKPTKLPSGKWLIRWFDAYGKRRAEAFATEAAARAALRRYEVERDDIRTGLARPRSDQTLREVAAEWLATRPPGRRDPAHSIHAIRDSARVHAGLDFASGVTGIYTPVVCADGAGATSASFNSPR